MSGLGNGALQKGLLEDLKWRGLAADQTDPELGSILDSRPLTVYCGFDPTSDSLHVGNLVPLLGLARLQRAGHRPIGVVGGATGLIGDPSGKSEERKLLTSEQIEANLAGVRKQVERFLDFGGPRGAVLANNHDWLGKLGYVEFLRDVGKHFSVNMMLAKESVRARVEDRAHGISYTEFSYMLLQSYDFLHLFDAYGCELQIGGSDQWGNITAGIDLIRRLRAKPAYGLTFPLITTATGAKFGKTEAGAVWLDARRTSVYDFYQYWIRTDDRDVGRYLRYFTFLPPAEIEALDREHQAHPEKRAAHTKLADETTRLVHGDEGVRAARQVTAILFGAEIADLTDEQVASIFRDAPATDVPRAKLDAPGLPVVDALVLSKLAASKGAARRLVEQGGAYVNNRKVESVDAALGAKDLASQTTLVLRAGKKNYHLLRFS